MSEVSMDSYLILPALIPSTTSALLRTFPSTPMLTESSAASFPQDRKSTRLNSSHLVISYAVFCLKKKKEVPGDTPVDDEDVAVDVARVGAEQERDDAGHVFGRGGPPEANQLGPLRGDPPGGVDMG